MKERYYAFQVIKGVCGVVVFELFFEKRLALALHIDDRRIASTCAIKIQYCFCVTGNELTIDGRRNGHRIITEIP